VRDRQRIVGVCQLALLAAAVATAAATSRASDWEPLALVAALFALAVGSDALALPTARGLRISGSFSALVLAMALLGPAPAVAIAVVSILIDAARTRPPTRYLISNLFAYAAFPLAGGLALQALDPVMGDPLVLAVTVVLVFLATNLLNFSLIYGYLAVAERRDWAAGFREHFTPVFPSEFAAALLTGCVVYVYHRAGAGAIALLAVVVLVFQYLMRTALDATERGKELAERNRQLASLQVGLISSMVKTLSLRDHMTARHSAAVARYGREVAAALGLSEREQELIHTAALFHDIGKFIFPDSILLADRPLEEADWVTVRRHPQTGAEIVANIEGYGPVAEIVRSHHERVDGSGYPDGLIGDAIPLGARIIAVADVYDVLTARDSYRTPVTSGEAIAELRRCAGRQLDAQMVEVFVDLVERRGVHFRHSTEADFEAELALERRVSHYARPRAFAEA